ncbi:hypothetical protein Pcinc_037372, partial [Petrolisthes cinctipes]
LPDQHSTTFPIKTTTPPSRPTQHHLPDQNNNTTFPTNTAPPHLLDQLQLPESVVEWHGRVPQHLQEAIHSPDDVGEALFLIGVERVKGRGGGVPFEGSVDVGSEAGQATLVHRHPEERREKRYRSLTKEVVREGRKGREYWEERRCEGGTKERNTTLEREGEESERMLKEERCEGVGDVGEEHNTEDGGGKKKCEMLEKDERRLEKRTKENETLKKKGRKKKWKL